MERVPPIFNLPKDGAIPSNCRLFVTSKKFIISAFVVLGILSVGLLIGVIVQANKKNNSQNNNSQSNSNNDVCLTDGCVSAAAHQLRSMDNSASGGLCVDFYTYACGGWQKTHPLQSFDVERTIIGDIVDRRNLEIQQLLEGPPARPNQESWEYKVKTYYRECRDDYARQVDAVQYLIGIIRDNNTINGWFMFDNGAPNASQTDLITTQSLYQQMSHIHGDLGAMPVFGIRTVFDEDDHNVKLLEFYPSGLIMEVNDYLGNDSVSNSRRAAYQLYIIEIMKLLARDAGVTDENVEDRAFTVANDVYTMERFLADSLRANPTPSKPRKMTIKEMTEQFLFEFDLLMAHELVELDPLILSKPVYVANNMYFTDAFELMTDTENELFLRMIHNYLRFHLVQTYINDLPYDYVHKYRQYLEAYYGYALHSSNDAYCTREVIRRFPLAIQRLYMTNSTRYTNAMKTVETVSSELLKGFTEYLKNNTIWMPDQITRDIARQKVKELKTTIGYASIISDDSLLDDYYAKFEVIDFSHLKNSYSYHYFHKWTVSNSLRNPNALDQWDFFETRPSRLFDYIPIFNRLFVVASGMHEPLVSSDWPWAMNIGSIGVLLAQKLFASIDGLEGRKYLANGTQFDWWEPPTVAAHNGSRNCITNYYVNEVKSLFYQINGALVQVNLAGEPFSPITLRHIGALRIAYRALLNNNEVKKFKMPGTNYTAEQTFFLAYAQTQCYQRDPLAQLLRTQLGTYDEGTALNAALRQMPEFAQAFQCPARPNPCV